MKAKVVKFHFRFHVLRVWFFGRKQVLIWEKVLFQVCKCRSAEDFGVDSSGGFFLRTIECFFTARAQRRKEKYPFL